MGTGSTAVAALATGNCFLGIDTDPMCPFALRAMLHKCKPLFTLRSEGLRSLTSEADGAEASDEGRQVKRLEVTTTVEEVAIPLVIGAEKMVMDTLDEGKDAWVEPPRRETVTMKNVPVMTLLPSMITGGSLKAKSLKIVLGGKGEATAAVEGEGT
jgi:hypothetical protein